MNDIQPFRIDVPQADLDDLADRLARTRWPDELPGAGWDYGIPLSRVRALAGRWLHGYDWRAHEAELNAHPQFRTRIDGQDLHFQHLRSGNPDALPLLLLHGWPGSVLEFRELLAPLAADFHLVVPSLPGFGFSGPTRERGWDQERIARALAELMTRLGYPRFGAHGGDWGSGIARTLGAVAAERVVGVHVSFLPTPGPADGLTGEDLVRARRTAAYAAARPGYQVLQATRPQTIAYALTDSPAGQLAWIAERFAEWTAPASVIDDDVLLTDVSIYWFTRTAGSSARLARESGPVAGCRVPLGVAVLPHDLVLPVRPLAARAYDLRHWTELPRGGHFAALEVPAELAADLMVFFRSLSSREP